jgi:cell division septum initiation protein DivIVA
MTLDMSGYKTSDLGISVDLDVYAVRNEAYKRSDKILKQLKRAEARVAELQAEMDDCVYALMAVSRELARLAAETIAA